MTSKSIYQSVGKILTADSTLKSYINNRVHIKFPMFKMTGMQFPLETMWLDDIGTDVRNIPSGVYEFEVGIWQSANIANALEILNAIKDRTKTLLNKQASTINAQGYDTKIRTFGLVSAILSTEFIGDYKLWFMPCTFSCIIDD